MTQPSLPDRICQFGRYLISGSLALAAHLVVLAALVEGLAMNASLATSIGFGVALIINYSIQHRWVFRAAGAHRILFTRYVCVTLITFALNLILFRFMYDGLGLWYLPAQIVTTGFIFVVNFVINRQYTFRLGV